MDLPHVELDHLAAAPLKLALVQTRFEPVITIEEREHVHALAQRLQPEWRLAERGQSQQTSFEIGPRGVVQQPSMPETVWLFRDPEDRYHAPLTATSLGLESTKYRHFPEFRERLETLLEGVREVFGPTRRIRHGVRYLNHVHDARLAEDGGPRRLLNAELLGPVGGSLGGRLVSSLSELRFGLEDRDSTLVVRHGLVDASTYLLDLDCYVEQPAAWDLADILARTDRYHALIERLFAWCLSEDYLAELRSGSGPTKRGAG